MKKKSIALRAVGLGYTYPGLSTPALENVSFELQKGTINILIGPNGSGKSTLLKSVLGILPATGQIEFFNKTGKKITKDQAHIGYVPQRLHIDTTLPLTVNELLRLTIKSCTRHKRKSQTGEKEIIAALKEVNALDLRFRKLGNLSGGQLQRVILARALFHNPHILILDEPEAGVDIAGEKFFYKVLKKLVKEKGITALIASHEMEIVSKYADQVLCINKTLVCMGTSAEALTSDNYKKLYGTHNQAYHHHHNHD